MSSGQSIDMSSLSSDLHPHRQEAVDHIHSVLQGLEQAETDSEGDVTSFNRTIADALEDDESVDSDGSQYERDDDEHDYYDWSFDRDMNLLYVPNFDLLQLYRDIVEGCVSNSVYQSIPRSTIMNDYLFMRSYHLQTDDGYGIWIDPEDVQGMSRIKCSLLFDPSASLKLMKRVDLESIGPYVPNDTARRIIQYYL